MLKIDTHAHYLPKHWPDLAAKYGDARFPVIHHGDDGRHRIYKDGKFFREIWPKTWDPDVRVADYARFGVQVQAISTVPVWKGSLPTAKLGAAGPVFVAVPRGEGAKLQTKVERTDPLVAPLTVGQRVGTLKVSTAAGVSVAEVPLVVQEAVPLAGIFGRAWDAMRLWIK